MDSGSVRISNRYRPAWRCLLFGMLFLEDGFRAFTGGFLETLLSRPPNRLWKSLSFGIVTTTVMQSRSLVSVIAISFLSAGMISLASGIGIIFGANIGTTTGAWLIAGFWIEGENIGLCHADAGVRDHFGFPEQSLNEGDGLRHAGLEYLFLGIHHMKEGFETFTTRLT